jgi:hypothetical protein
MMQLETVTPRWRDEPVVIVAAPGPSLTPEVAEQCKGFPTIVVQDAYRRLPWAEALYACDLAWFLHHKGAQDFQGEIWSTTDTGNNDKRHVADNYGVRLVEGKHADGFSTDPAVIHYGHSSGFQAVNLAILFGAKRIVLVGFDMRKVGGSSHYFGEHAKPLRNPSSFGAFIRAFEAAAKAMPPGVTIENATPGSALRAFPIMPLQEALGMEMAA